MFPLVGVYSEPPLFEKKFACVWENDDAVDADAGSGRLPGKLDPTDSPGKNRPCDDDIEAEYSGGLGLR